MNVLHVVAYYPPDRMGGVGEVVAHLHRELLRQGHASSVWTAGRGGRRGGSTQTGVERIAEGPLGFVLALARRAERAATADVIHCHHGDALLLLLALRSLRRRPPVLVTYHVGHRGMARAHRPYRLAGRRFDTGASGFLYRHGTARLHRTSDRLSLALADAASFVCRSTARDVLGAERGARAPVVYNAVPDPGDVAEPGDGGVRGGGEAVEPSDLLYVGTGGPRKRLLALPFVLERVRRARPGARLRVVGVELAREPALARLLDELGLRDAVRCEGVVPSAAVRRFYRAAGVLVVPSAYEGLPMVVIEGFQCGLPCVATRVSGHPEAVGEGVNGYLVEPDAPEALADRCLEILEQPALRARMAEAARRVAAARFGLARQAAEYLALYRRLVEAAG